MTDETNTTPEENEVKTDEVVTETTEETTPEAETAPEATPEAETAPEAETPAEPAA